MSAPTPVFAAKELSVKLGARTIIAPHSGEVCDSELLAVVGPNGAGKTTLLKAMAGLLPYGGSLRHDGREVWGLSPFARARSIAYVPQRSALAAPLLVREVVAMARFAREADPHQERGDDTRAIEEALRAVDALELAAAPFTQLSGGEQRRVLLARALATGARTLLLDEPSASLDVEHQLHLFHQLRALVAAGYCLVTVLHDLDEVRRYADRALLLVNGHVCAQGTAKEVIESQAVEAAYGVSLIEAERLGYRLRPRG